MSFARGTNIITCTNRARQYARELARTKGLVLGKFRLVKGSDDAGSLLGPEWAAFPVRDQPGIAMVWRVADSEAHYNEALRTCTVCRRFGNWLFGITVRAK